MTSNENVALLPFLKWAGGKRWFIKNFSKYLPNNFKNYYEPFLGSAAVFFHLQPKEAVLSDINSNLINTYNAIKNDWKKVFDYLLEHEKNHSKTYYYNIRNEKFTSLYKRAAQFIYLNRTCWNGLYRVNLNGNFNVPKGTKDNVILRTDKFEEISKLLKKACLYKKDFEEVIGKAQKGDFIFIDPPYTVKHDNNGFIKYNEALFTWEDQIRLSEVTIRAVERGAKILMTNAHHKSIKELYKNDFEIKSISRNSIIAANSKFRTNCKELLIRSKNV